MNNNMSEDAFRLNMQAQAREQETRARQFVNQRALENRPE